MPQRDEQGFEGRRQNASSACPYGVPPIYEYFRRSHPQPGPQLDHAPIIAGKSEI
ncbi:MAG: hypothetical protein DSM106950_00600 [Stigonema ocellatum SAG 48.90 = DSM 106950]|nr:hypothetical protein [Stigonema ocellatum SAG 48.90 = DSM 106950]